MPISRIQIEVDRATYLNWARAVARLRHGCSAALRLVGNLIGIPAPPSQINFTGFEILEMVGLASTRPHVIDDPERLFALLRYCTKVTRLAANFRLVRDVGDLDPHKKRVLSDELGCGFALLACDHWLGTHLYLDLHEAVRRGLAHTTASSYRQPDYLAMGGPRSSIVVLEAKGTQSRGYCQQNQIPSGCQQVRAVQISGHANPARVVIGVELQRIDQPHQTALFVGDPEPDEDQSDKYEFREKIDEVIAKAHLSRMATLIGDTDLLRRIDPEARETWPDEVTFTRQELAGRNFVGSRMEIVHGNSVTGIFVGIDSSFREQALGVLPSATLLALMGPGEPQASPAEEDFSAFHIGASGLGFYVRSEGPLAGEVFAEATLPAEE